MASADYANIQTKDVCGGSTSPIIPTHQTIECKLYTRRYFILALFVIYSMSNSLQWIQYSIVTDHIVKYYGVTSFHVDCTSMIYMLVYIPLIFPGSWFLDKYGIRKSVLIGATFTCLGAWIKILSLSPDRFWVTFLGQTIVACSQIFILNIPAQLAATWFGRSEVSTACSVGVFGNQLGIALGFLVPPILLRYGIDELTIQDGLENMYYSVAGLTTLVLILVVVFFQNTPPLPPSPAQAVQRSVEDSTDFFLSMKHLVYNPGYLYLLLSYGINVGVFYAISTLLNQVVLSYFPGRSEDAGRIGLVIVLAGTLGSVLSGIVLDKTKKFKETTLGIYAFSLVGMVIYSLTLSTGVILIVYITAGFLGFFMTGYLPVGFELAAELTYPEPEGTSSGLLNASAQVFGILFTVLYGQLINAFGDVIANIALCIALVLGTLLTYIIPDDMRRQAAHSKDFNVKPVV
uniref:Choline/ethanolamine transporter FLVCR1 n=1 Tax=Cacopsylla melanoneura TaxID=428564 RepID=A0A8D9A8M8_9HEMI